MAKYKRKRIIRFFIVPIIILITAVVILGGVAISPLCSVKKITITGVKRIPEKKIIAALKIPTGTNVFIDTKGSLLDKLFMTFKPYEDKLTQTFPYIENVNIYFDLGSGLTVDIKERKPFAYIVDDKYSKYILIDAAGKILAVDKTQKEAKIVMLKGVTMKKFVVGETVDIKKVDGIKKVKRVMNIFENPKLKFPKDLIQKVKWFDITNVKNIEMALSNDRLILLGNIDSVPDVNMARRFSNIIVALKDKRLDQPGKLEFKNGDFPIWSENNLGG
ncbi:MAG: FtsQ-type POTRA domain-containing protein [Bacillota bacterium]